MLTFQNGLTPLIKAAEAGHLDIVQYFVENGCDINEQDREVRIYSITYFFMYLLHDS